MTSAQVIRIYCGNPVTLALKITWLDPFQYALAVEPSRGHTDGAR